MEKFKLNDQRMEDVVQILKASGVRRVLDLGCGDGKMLRELLRVEAFTEIVGMDLSHLVLERAKERLHWERMPPSQRQRIRLLQGSMIYCDIRMRGFDAAIVVEVIEHLDLETVAAFEKVLFSFTRPGLVVLTTPNVEYNVTFPDKPPGIFRHADHRFEWTRKEFQDWALAVAKRHDYTVTFQPVGPEDPILGAPTQMGIFRVREEGCINSLSSEEQRN